MRIGVIKEEADEQMTLTSMKSDKRPHVQSIFSPGPPPPSAPMSVPGTEHSRNGEIFSTSAPATGVVDNGESVNERRYIPGPRLILFNDRRFIRLFPLYIRICWIPERNDRRSQLDRASLTSQQRVTLVAVLRTI